MNKLESTEISLEVEKDKNTKNAVALFFAGLILAVGVVFVLIICILLRSDAPYYSYRRYWY
jgi:hypothetical protein